MLNHKVFEVLFTFNRKEMSRFEEFVHSPYYNKHTEVQQLVTYLSKIYPAFDDKKCASKRLKEKVFLKQKFHDAQLALVFTYTRRLLDRFLSTERFKEKTFDDKLMLLGALRDRKCFKFYEKQLRSLQKSMQDIEIKDSLYFQNQYKLANEADYFFNIVDRRVDDPSLELKERNLDYFYMTEKLKDAVEMHIRKNILRVNYSNRMLDGVLAEVTDNLKEYEQVPALFVYFKLYQMTTKEADVYYREALDFVEKNEQYLQKNERITIYNYFQNYCIKQINKNQKHFLSELFNLYKLQLKKELIFDDNFLSEWHYKNIVTTGIRLSETAWVVDFIEAYKMRLRPESIENAYRFNLAAYFHAVQNYDKVLELLVHLEYSDLRYNLGAKALLLRTYYEMKEDETLLALTASFRQYLHRNNLMADSRRNAYYNLFKFTKRAAKLRAEIPFISTQKAQKSIKKLKKDIMEASVIFNKAWLEEKVGELDVLK